ncbi:MAG: succinate dehydrogenase assembly factor 2 [Candidatus Thiodiazotropha sp.]
MVIQHGDPANIERLRWQCRRGMLELDVLLEAFLDQCFADLPAHQKDLFVQLLEYPDPLIHAWTIGGEPPDDKALMALIANIRKTKVP